MRHGGATGSSLFYVFPVLKEYAGSKLMVMAMDPARHDEDEVAWWRTFVFPEEDRPLFTTAKWDGGYRWFRAPNVVCLEQYRRKKHPARLDTSRKQ